MGVESTIRSVEAFGHALTQDALDADISKRLYFEHATTTFLDQFSGNLHCPLRLWCCDGSQVAGVLENVGADWLLLCTSRLAIVTPTAAILVAQLPSRRLQTKQAKRLTFSQILRRLSREQVPSRLHLHSAGQRAAAWDGTVVRVGADYFDFHRAPDPPRVFLSVPYRSVLSIACPRGSLIHASTQPSSSTGP